LLGSNHSSIAVVDGEAYLGVARIEDVRSIDRREWATTCTRDVMRTDLPVAEATWLLGDAIQALTQSASDRIAVCDDGRFVGMVTATDLVELDELLEAMSRST